MRHSVHSLVVTISNKAQLNQLNSPNLLLLLKIVFMLKSDDVNVVGRPTLEIFASQENIFLVKSSLEAYFDLKKPCKVGLHLLKTKKKVGLL